MKPNQRELSSARQVAFLPWHHRDPFDRMLVSQAQAENLILLTSDATIQRYGSHVRLLPPRS